MTTYQTTLENITPQVLEGFFVGWLNPPTPQAHLEILRHSAYVVLALENDQVVGFVTAISDGVLSAYIPLLEVAPKFQGQGIGRGLMEHMKKLLESLYMVDILCDDDVKPFYEKLGFIPAGGVMIRNYAWNVED